MGSEKASIGLSKAVTSLFNLEMPILRCQVQIQGWVVRWYKGHLEHCFSSSNLWSQIGSYQMGSSVCVDLEPMYSNRHACLHGIGFMEIHCQMNYSVCMELEYIGIYGQMDMFVCMELWALFVCLELECLGIHWWNGPACLHGIGNA